jgi:phosphopantetheine--protein transferase-like protein
MKITGIGIDLCRVDRIGLIRQKKYWNRFLRRVLHFEERTEAVSDQFVASRWAAKEALVKASGFRDIRFDLVRVVKENSGRPGFCFSDLRLQGFEIFLSISHEDGIAAAVVVVSGKE